MALNIADLCTTLQESLLPIAGGNAPVSRSKTGFLDSLFSPINRQGFKAVPLRDQGRERQVRIQYLQQPSTSSVLSGPIGTVRPNLCSNVVAPTELTGKTVTVTQEAFIPFSMDENMFRDFCTWNMDEHRMWMMNVMIAPLLQRIDQLLLTKWVATMFGAYYDQGAPASKNFQLLNNGGESANYAAFVDLLTEYMKIRGVGGKPIIVGDGNMSKFMQLMMLGCCNADGIDLSQAKGDAYFFYDIDASSVANGLGAANRFIAYSPGSLQFIQYLANEGQFMQMKEDYERRIIVDPVSGMTLDFEMKYVECDREFKFSLGTAFDLYGLPDDMYLGTGGMENVNGSLLGVATSA